MSDVITWEGYIGFDPGIDRPLREVTRPQAREYFDRFMRATEERPVVLRRLLAANGVILETVRPRSISSTPSTSITWQAIPRWSGSSRTGTWSRATSASGSATT